MAKISNFLGVVVLLAITKWSEAHLQGKRINPSNKTKINIFF